MKIINLLMWAIIFNSPRLLLSQIPFEGTIQYAKTYSSTPVRLVESLDSTMLHVHSTGFYYSTVGKEAIEVLKPNTLAAVDSTIYSFYPHIHTVLIARYASVYPKRSDYADIIKYGELDVTYTGNKLNILGVTCSEYLEEQTMGHSFAYWVADSLIFPFPTILKSCEDSTFGAFLPLSKELRGTGKIILGVDSYKSGNLKSSTRAIRITYQNDMGSVIRDMIKINFNSIPRVRAIHGDYKKHKDSLSRFANKAYLEWLKDE